MTIMDEDFDAPKDGNPYGNATGNSRDQATLKNTIIDLRSQNYTYKEICAEVKIHYQTIWDWQNQDPTFRKGMEWAEAARTDALEASMMKHATDGFSRVMVSNGRVIMDPDNQTKPLMEKVFDNGLRQFLLKGRDRKYGDKVDTNANITVRSDTANAELEAAISAISAREQADDSEAAAGDAGVS